MVNEGAPSAKGSTWDDVRVRESSALTMTHDVRYSPPRALVQDVADPRGPRPKRVSTAMRILWASFVLGTPSSVYQLAREPEWLVVVFMLLITVLVILLYLKIGAGRNWARIVLAVLQAVGVPALAMPVNPRSSWTTTALRQQQLTLSSMGLRRPTIGTVALAAALFVVTLFLLPLVTEPLVAWLGAERRDSAVRELAALPVWFRVATGLMGGAIEETLYRGYAVGRLEALTGRRGLAGAIVVAVFTLAHVPLWGIVFSVVAILPFSALMTAAYVWRRDLLANSAAHIAALLVGLLTI